MTPMQAVTYLGILLMAAAVHGLILRFAVRLMVNASLPMLVAYGIIAAEYAVAGATIGLLLVAGNQTWQLQTGLAAAGLAGTGAVLIGRRVALPEGTPVGTGNGILIQFMQVPMIIPPLILLSFFIVPPG